MILEIDVGNTRLKWRLVDDSGRRVAGGANARGDADLLAGLPAGKIDRARVSNVTGPETAQRIRAWCRDRAGIEAEFATSMARCAGVVNGYAQPERLGVDRWLAVLAAFDRHRGACCVVDSGSALTVDFVDASGGHHGGLIAPGLTMMRRSLLRDTQEIRLIAEEQEWDRARLGGTSTEEAVLGGIIGMACGVIEDSVERFRTAQQRDVHVLITGGEAPLLRRHLAVDAEYDPDLVLDGLSVALP